MCGGGRAGSVPIGGDGQQPLAALLGAGGRHHHQHSREDRYDLDADDLCAARPSVHDIWVVGAAGEAENDLNNFKHKGGLAWVLGAEGEGLRRLTRETCDELVRIQMLGSVESLNVSVSAGICLFEARRQRSVS